MATCKECDQPLTLEVEDDEPSEYVRMVPDDVELPCGCHFHWQCLIDSSAESGAPLTCPSCHKHIGTTAGSSSATSSAASHAGERLLVRYTNEGGIQEGLDVLPAILEEQFLVAHPDRRPAHALFLMCAEGDVAGIVQLVSDSAEDVESPLELQGLVSWQDPLHGDKTGLHAAIENTKLEVVWLLLWLASTLPEQAFPDEAGEIVQSLQIPRLASSADQDIRRLRDQTGRTAEDLARQLGGPWTMLIEAGILAVG